MAADSEISLLTRGSTLSKASRKTWSSQPTEEEEEQSQVKFLPPEGGIPSPQLRCSESESSSIHEATSKTRPSDATQARLSVSFDTIQISVGSTDTTLEYYDAPQSEDQEGQEGYTATDKDEGIVTLNIEASPTTEQTTDLTSENTEREEAVVKEDKTLEDVTESGLEQEAKNEEEVQSKKEDEQDIESSSKDEDAAPLQKEEIPSHSQGKNFPY